MISTKIIHLIQIDKLQQYFAFLTVLWGCKDYVSVVRSTTLHKLIYYPLKNQAFLHKSDISWIQFNPTRMKIIEKAISILIPNSPARSQYHFGSIKQVHGQARID